MWRLGWITLKQLLKLNKGEQAEASQVRTLCRTGPVLQCLIISFKQKRGRQLVCLQQTGQRSFYEFTWTQPWFVRDLFCRHIYSFFELLSLQRPLIYKLIDQTSPCPHSYLIGPNVYTGYTRHLILSLHQSVLGLRFTVDENKVHQWRQNQ